MAQTRISLARVPFGGSVAFPGGASVAVDRLRVDRARRDYLGSPTGYLETHLTEEERETFSGFVAEKRKFEWLAARVVAKRLVCRSLEESGVVLLPNELSIRKVGRGPRKGKPMAVSVSRSLGDYVSDISLTHSPSWAVCAVTRGGRIGVDVEGVKELSSAVCRMVFTDREAEVAASMFPNVDPGQLSILWSVKESLLKAFGIGFSSGWGTARLADYREGEMTFEASLPSLYGDGSGLRAVYGFFDDHVFTATLVEPLPKQKTEQFTRKGANVDTPE